jgi:signal transduction protein with GAF and PtsI domain
MTDRIQTWLEAFLAQHGGRAGTVHLRTGELLHLGASVGIPLQVIERTRTIPHGKGMAGLAWQRREPVQTCNLQEDTSGDVKPGAKAVDARAALALPVLEEDEVRAVVGIAWDDERALDESALEALLVSAATLLEP